MQRFKQQVDQLQHQLAGLTRGQKAFAIALAALMLLAVVWWVRLAPVDEMVLLFEEPAVVNPQQITSALASHGIAHEVQDGQIYVPSRVRGEARAALAWDRLLPSDSHNRLDEAIDKIGSFDVRQKIDARLLNAKCEELKNTIERLPGVSYASVHLNPVYKRQIGESLLPTAAVAITTSSQADVHRLAQAVSCLLANSISGLRPENVAVLIDGSLISAASADNLLNARELHARSELERHFAGKVRDALGEMIPGLMASVTVDMSATVGHLPVAAAMESVGDAGARAELAEAETDRPLSLKDVVTVFAKPAPDSVASSANTSAKQTEHRQLVPTRGSLVIPMSWMVQQWQSRNRTSEFPPPEALAQFKDAKLQELRHLTATTLGGISPEHVSIIVDDDAALAGEEEPALTMEDNRQESPAISALVRNWGREVAVAALGAVSVLLVSSMLKKSAVGGAVIAESSLAFAPEGIDPAALDYLAGESFLASGQVLEQARSMILQDPDGAAAVLRQWVHAG